jgi:hypothetical protein
MKPEVARVIGGAEIIPRLPDSRSHERGDELPRGLVGGRIVGFGTLKSDVSSISGSRLEGGGLVIDYVPESSIDTHRAALGFNELGMWVAYEGKI